MLTNVNGTKINKIFYDKFFEAMFPPLGTKTVGVLGKVSGCRRLTSPSRASYYGMRNIPRYKRDKGDFKFAYLALSEEFNCYLYY